MVSEQQTELSKSDSANSSLSFCSATTSLLGSSPNNVIISDVVRFSLCSLCSIKLNELYPETYHE